MKKFNLIIAVIISIYIIFPSLVLDAQENTSATPDKIGDYLGGRMFKIFQTFGHPTDVFCSSDANNETILDYGKFAFQIGKKTVTIVYCWGTYDKAENGIKIGDLKKDVEAKLGKPDKEKNSTLDSSLIWIWNYKETERYFVIFYDEDAKVKKMQWELMD